MHAWSSSQNNFFIICILGNRLNVLNFTVREKTLFVHCLFKKFVKFRENWIFSSSDWYVSKQFLYAFSKSVKNLLEMLWCLCEKESHELLNLLKIKDTKYLVEILIEITKPPRGWWIKVRQEWIVNQPPPFLSKNNRR